MVAKISGLAQNRSEAPHALGIGFGFIISYRLIAGYIAIEGAHRADGFAMFEDLGVESSGERGNWKEGEKVDMAW